MKEELVKNWMTPNPVTVTPETLLPEMHQLMHNHQIRRLPVMQGQKIVGIVTLGDVREAEPSSASSLSIWEINYLLARLQASEIMSPTPITVSPDDKVSKVAQLMLEHKISGLPVVEPKGDLMGMITESDIFRMVAAQWLDEENDSRP